MDHKNSESHIKDTNSNNLPDIFSTHNENQPILTSSSSNNSKLSKKGRSSSRTNSIIDDPEFIAALKQAESAIECGVLPIRIASGSSGSYFVRNLEGKIIGVFKPKDEEPYGHFNPKWTKLIQRNLCPCCFGRGCLVPNQGYLSEAGASIIDSKLRLNLVPKTRVVRLTAESFNYPTYQRFLLTSKRGTNNILDRCMPGKRIFQVEGLRSKIGSFQFFVDNYMSADVFLKQLEAQSLPEEAMNEFQKQFERLVIIDYIIRNTDRNNDNWLVKCEIKQDNERDHFLQAVSNSQFRLENETNNSNESDSLTGTTKATLVNPPKPTYDIRIAAIDNGLAFPFKHPDEWRAYPFHWATLKQAKQPFSEEIKAQILPYITDMNFVQHELCDEIAKLFSQDKQYSHRLVERQLSVMRGQILNLVQAMRDGKSPFELVQMPGLLVEHLYSDGASGSRKFKKKFNDRYPLFPWF